MKIVFLKGSKLIVLFLIIFIIASIMIYVNPLQKSLVSSLITLAITILFIVYVNLNREFTKSVTKKHHIITFFIVLLILMIVFLPTVYEYKHAGIYLFTYEYFDNLVKLTRIDFDISRLEPTTLISASFVIFCIYGRLLRKILIYDDADFYYQLNIEIVE